MWTMVHGLDVILMVLFTVIVILMVSIVTISYRRKEWAKRVQQVRVAQEEPTPASPPTKLTPDQGPPISQFVSFAN